MKEKKSKEEKPRKKAGELTTAELARRLFPPVVRREVASEVAEKPKKSEKDSTIEGQGR